MGRQSKGNYKCLVCDEKISDKNYSISRHVKKHYLTLDSYITKYYKLIGGCIEKCGFCTKNAVPNWDINHKDYTYSLSYENGYSCKTIECKEQISMDILGHGYISKKFEKIGSRYEYIMKLHKIDAESAKNMKFKAPTNIFNCSVEQFTKKYGEEEGLIRYNKRKYLISKNSARNKFPCTLENFIKRYGIIDGTKKYNDRCDKISYTSSKDYLISKYGEEKGNDMWKNKYKSTRISKASKQISEILDILNINYEIEKSIKSKFVDYYLTDYNIIIEFYGDYWHANPKRYESDYYINQFKMTANEIWEKDKKRINILKESSNSIIIIWESTLINETILENTIDNIKDKKTILYL